MSDVSDLSQTTRWQHEKIFISGKIYSVTNQTISVTSQTSHYRMPLFTNMNYKKYIVSCDIQYNELYSINDSRFFTEQMLIEAK